MQAQTPHQWSRLYILIHLPVALEAQRKTKQLRVRTQQGVFRSPCLELHLQKRIFTDLKLSDIVGNLLYNWSLVGIQHTTSQQILRQRKKTYFICWLSHVNKPQPNLHSGEIYLCPEGIPWGIHVLLCDFSKQRFLNNPFSPLPKPVFRFLIYVSTPRLSLLWIIVLLTDLLDCFNNKRG